MDFDSNEPISQSNSYMTVLLGENIFTQLELLNSIDDFTLIDLQKFINLFLSKNLYIESIVYGNISKKVSHIIYSFQTY